MYHGAHWRCGPAQAERINVEDRASTETETLGKKRILRASHFIHIIFEWAVSRDPRAALHCRWRVLPWRR
jgi:hypothetical protein